jgi:hypothetical protein
MPSTPAQPAVPVPMPATVTIPASAPGASTPAAEQPPRLTRLQIHTSSSAKHARKLTVAYTLSAPGSVDLAIDRRILSHSCPRGMRACIRWLPTKVKLEESARTGHHSATLSLAALTAGDYRLDATPVAHSGAAGATQRPSFELHG